VYYNTVIQARISLGSRNTEQEEPGMNEARQVKVLVVYYSM